jgi:MFS family permease
MVGVLGRSRLSVSILFLVHGLIFSTWVSRIPAVQNELGLRPSELGLALLGVAAGSMISMPVSGILMARFGTGIVAAVSSLMFCLALGLPALAESAVSLALALGVLGLAAGAMDVSMNAQGVAVEERYGRSLMASFHALFSIGGMAGAALGGAIAGQGIGPRLHLASAGAFCLILVAAAIPGLVPHDRHGVTGQHLRFRITPKLLALALIAFCFFLSEGAIADWSGLYLRQDAAAGPATAALGYAVFSAVMALGRVTGDRLINRFGRVALVRAGSLTAAAGLGAALVAGTVPVALIGFGLMGAGCSVIVPIVFAAAGRMPDLPPGTALTAVTSFGYLGLFAGPPSIGFLAEATGLRVALGVVVCLLVSGMLLARSARNAR